MEHLLAAARAKLAARLIARRARRGAPRPGRVLTACSRESECLGLELRSSYLDARSAAALRCVCTVLATVAVHELCEATGGFSAYKRLFRAEEGAADALFAALSAALRCDGYAVQDDFLPSDLASALASCVIADVGALSSDGSGAVHTPARTAAAAAGTKLNLAWRTPTPYAWRDDVIAWVTPAQMRESDLPRCFQILAERMADLQRRLGRILALEEEEATTALAAAAAGKEEGRPHSNHNRKRSSGGEPYQIACFRPGRASKGYVRHVDEDVGKIATGGRRITVTVYLSRGWTPGHGGELRLWPRRTRAGAAGGVVDIEPIAGRVVIFLSGAVWHQVRPWRQRRDAGETEAKRIALTAWLH